MQNVHFDSAGASLLTAAWAVGCLQGLWLHGNLLERLPESIGQLASLRTLSLSGNCLPELPANVGALSVRRPRSRSRFASRAHTCPEMLDAALRNSGIEERVVKLCT